MINKPEPVTEDGDVIFHGKEGLRLPINFQLADGTARDMAAVPVKFYIEAGPTFVLIAGATDDEKVLLIPEGSCDALIGKKTNFALVDESVDPPAVEWSGTFLVTGFA